MPELTFCLHNGYYVADATMVELYAKFRPGRLVTEDFSGNAFILSPDDLSEEEEVWLVSIQHRWAGAAYILASIPTRDERKVLAHYSLSWTHKRKEPHIRIERPHLFVVLSEIEIEQPAHNWREGTR